LNEETHRMPGDVRGDETILVVDDDDMLRNMAVKILQGHGYAVLAASSCSKAMEVLADYRGPLHLLLTDVIMPGGSGQELFTQVAGRFAAVKVVFMSGYTDDALGLHGVLEEGIAFIQKPFSVKGLAAKIREVIDGPCSHPEPVPWLAKSTEMRPGDASG
jgi:two-component system, cell cycle sensor histidine kinase and response regulator CckA